MFLMLVGIVILVVVFVVKKIVGIQLTDITLIGKVMGALALLYD